MINRITVFILLLLISACTTNNQSIPLFTDIENPELKKLLKAELKKKHNIILSKTVKPQKKRGSNSINIRDLKNKNPYSKTKIQLIYDCKKNKAYFSNRSITSIEDEKLHDLTIEIYCKKRFIFW